MRQGGLNSGRVRQRWPLLAPTAPPGTSRPPPGPALDWGAHKLHRHQPRGQRHLAVGARSLSVETAPEGSASTTVLASTRPAHRLSFTLIYGHEEALPPLTPRAPFQGSGWWAWQAQAHTGFLLRGPQFAFHLPACSPQSAVGTPGAQSPLTLLPRFHLLCYWNTVYGAMIPSC